MNALLVLAPRGSSLLLYGHTDTVASKKYALEYDTQYIPLDIYTLDVDYTDVDVQVSFHSLGIRGAGGDS